MIKTGLLLSALFASLVFLPAFGIVSTDFSFEFGDLESTCSDDDNDQDGLLNIQENLDFETDPEIKDTDGDGLSDFIEALVIDTDPLTNGDKDGDGLFDSDEILIHQSNPSLADTDGNGINDLEQVESGQSPADTTDSDGDGLSDLIENILGTDPQNPDTDGDERGTDKEELIRLTNPLSNIFGACGGLGPPTFSSLRAGADLGDIDAESVIFLELPTPLTIARADLDSFSFTPSTSGDDVKFRYTVFDDASHLEAEVMLNPDETAMFFEVGISGIDLSKTSSFLENQTPVTEFFVDKTIDTGMTYADNCPVVSLYLFEDGIPQKIGDPLNPKNYFFYVANSAADYVSVFDANTNLEIKQIPVGPSPFQIAHNVASNILYVINHESDKITVIDGNSNQISETIPVGSNTKAIAVNPQTGILYVTDSKGILSVFNDTNKVSAIKVGRNPNAIGIDEKSNTVYVANTGDNTISVLDGLTNKIIDTVGVGANPSAIAINSDTNTIYVVNKAAGKVSVIDGTTNKVVDSIKVGKDPSAIQVHTETEFLFVANSADNTISVIDIQTGQTQNRELFLINQKEPDSDGDKIPDGIEIANGTDPQKADTDGDGLSDLIEEEYNLDALVSDIDSDGLSDGKEIEIGSNPLIADTDGDEILDGVDSDPTSITEQDSDGDGISDFEEEIIFESDPNNPDSDGDGLSDFIEALVLVKDLNLDDRLAPLHTSQTLPDSDGDGISDGDEVKLGSLGLDSTDPELRNLFANPTTMILNSNTDRLYVTNNADDTVSIVSALTGQVLGKTNVGAGPSGIAINIEIPNPVRDPASDYANFEANEDGTVELVYHCAYLANAPHFSEFAVAGINSLFNPGATIPVKTGSSPDTSRSGEDIDEISSAINIPQWIRNNAEWWSEDLIADSDFISGIEFLIKQGILQIPQTDIETESTSDEIPNWIKLNAGWWADGSIADEDFVNGLEWLIKSGIITI